ncbi:MAG TPA: pitrilysin family protein [Pyrinomonadaceae bacterium]|jgi:Predicted Zn-dependent peptidases|nr:pitrilysin family protein [Pyrinomonadaceae bacterium]
MRRVSKFLSALLVCTLSVIAVQAQTAGNVRVDFKETTLKNGLRVITVEDHSAPVIAVSVTYNVGSRNERQGRTGFAHLFEHMMFKGSENVGSGEHFLLVFNNGGTMNGTTNEDRTNYFEALPANQLDLALFLEADRMRSLAITKDNLDNQRNAVQEERRLGVDNQAYGKSGEVQQELIYDNFAYKHTTIGSMDDLNAASVEDVAAFFKMYYAPNNAVLTVVGDFKTADALAKVRSNFEAIQRQPDPPSVDMTEPQQTAERRANLDDTLARALRIDIAYKAVPGNSPDFYALQVLANALQSGQSSRLYQKLVKEKEMLTNVGGFMDEKRGVGALYTNATLRPGVKPEDVEAVVYAEIDRLKKEPIADWELQKAKNTTRRNFINGLQSSLSRAVTVGQYTVYYNEPNLINTRLDKVNAVTKEDVQRVANKYLIDTNRTVVTTMPKAKTRATTGASGQ